MSVINAAIAEGGAAAPLLLHLETSRRSVAARSRSGSCTATSPRALQATPQVPMAVSKTQWLMTGWSLSIQQHVGSDAPPSTRNPSICDLSALNLSVLLALEIGFHR